MFFLFREIQKTNQFLIEFLIESNRMHRMGPSVDRIRRLFIELD